jgi:hypothetical protein
LGKYYVVYLNNLGIALSMQFERMESMENLDWAIATHKQAIESTSGRHPDHVMYLTKLGNAVQY